MRTVAALVIAWLASCGGCESRPPAPAAPDLVTARAQPRNKPWSEHDHQPVGLPLPPPPLPMPPGPSQSYEPPEREPSFTRLDDETPPAQLLCARARHEPVVLDEGPFYAPHLVWVRDRFALLWHDGGQTPGELQLAFVGVDGRFVQGSRRQVSAVDGEWSAFGRMAVGDEQIGLAYLDDREGTRAVRFMRLDLRGSPIAGSDVRLSPPGYRAHDRAHVTWNGARREWVALWSDLYLSRIRADGRVRGDAEQINGGRPAAVRDDGGDAVVWNGKTLVAAWSEYEKGTVVLAEIDEHGARPLQRWPAQSADLVAVASDGSGYALAWLERDPGSGHRTTVRVVLTGTRMEPITFRGGSSDSPTLVFHGGAYWLTWSEVQASGGFGRIQLARISRQGSAERRTLATPAGYTQTPWPTTSVSPCGIGIAYQLVERPGIGFHLLAPPDHMPEMSDTLVQPANARF